MTDTNRATIQPASSVAAPALRKRFYEAHRFLSRVAQFPLVMAKLYSDGLDHPQFFAALGELLPLERLCFCLWEPTPDDFQQVELWTWEAKRPLATAVCEIDTSLLQSLSSKPMRLNECHSEMGEEQLLNGMHLWGEETRSMLALPLHLDDATMGVMLMCAHQAARYNDGDFAHAQFLADALGPMVSNRLIANAKDEAERVTLANLEEANASANEELELLRAQLAEAEEAREAAEARVASLEKEQRSAGKRIEASKQERSRLNEQLHIYREERNIVRQLCERFAREARRAINDGEQLRQVLLRTHRSVSMFRQLAEQRIKDGVAASQTQTELILDASSQMIPEALNSLNHLTSLQDPSFGQLNSRQQRFVRFSLRSVRYISQLLSELNDYNRCMLGQLELRPESIRLDPIFDEVRAKFHSHIKQKRLILQWDRGDSVGGVLGDAYVTRQILYTMLEHAVDATPISGSIDFSLDAHDEDSYVLRVVHDSEIELLQQDDLERLFIPFQRPDFDPDDDIPPGLSLALARELTLLHQGDIEVHQEADRLRFSIYLPLVLTPSEEPRSSGLSYTPMLELPPLDEEWEQPFDQRYHLPQLPSVMATSSDQLPRAPQTGAFAAFFDGGTVSSSGLPQPPRSLSSPSLPTFPSMVEETTVPKAALGEADAFLEAAPTPDPSELAPVTAAVVAAGVDPEELFIEEPEGDELLIEDPDFDEVEVELIEDSASLFVEEELGTPAPPTHASSSDVIDSGEDAATMMSPSVLAGSSSALTPPPLPRFTPPPISGSYGLPDDDLEAELELEDNAPTQLFRVGPTKNETPSSVVFEVEAIDGEDSFILEEIEEVDDFNDVDDDFVIEELEDEPEYLTPSGNRRSVTAPLLYLSSETNSAPPSLFSLFDAWGMPLLEKPNSQVLMKSLSQPLPGAVALISTDPMQDHAALLIQLQRSLTAQRLPLLNIQQFPEREARIQLHFAEHQSDYLKESFWLGWLDRIRHPHTDKPRQVLSIGFDALKEEPVSLLDFCCGKGYELSLENNPALGVQRLYKEPPDLLMIQLDDPLDHWTPLLEEVGRSGRTRDIPIVFFSQHEPTAALERALKPLHFLFLLAR